MAAAALSTWLGDRVWIEQVGTSTRCVVTPNGLDTTSSSAHCGSGWVLDPVRLFEPPAVNGPAPADAARVEDSVGSLVLVYPGQDGAGCRSIGDGSSAVGARWWSLGDSNP